MIVSSSLSIDPNYWQAYVRLGEVLERLHQWDEAIETLNASLSGDPG